MTSGPQPRPDPGRPDAGRPDAGRPDPEREALDGIPVVGVPTGPDGGSPADETRVGAPGADEVDELVALAQDCLDMARQGQAEQLALYLDAGVPVELADTSGNSLLMLAAYHGHAGTVAVLAERGADVDRLNDRGQSPLAGALFKAEAEVVATLLRHGADLDTGQPSARDTAAVFGQQHLLEAAPEEDGRG